MKPAKPPESMAAFLARLGAKAPPKPKPIVPYAEYRDAKKKRA